MANDPSPLETGTKDSGIAPILEWMVFAHDRQGADDVAELREQLARLGGLTVHAGALEQTLDLFHAHVRRVAEATLAGAGPRTLPAPKAIRQQARLLQECLALFIHACVDTLSGLFDPERPEHPRSPEAVLQRIIQCCAWHLSAGRRAGAPDAPGIWQHLHAAFRTARRLGTAKSPGPAGEESLESAYGRLLLIAVAQPASFSGKELAFLEAYVAANARPPDILDTAPRDRDGVFWIDLDADFPAYALRRRPPPADLPVLYFTADLAARDAMAHLAAIDEGTPPEALGLPPGAASVAGCATLRRLGAAWGSPARRRFPRRRQSYRALVLAGFDQLWRALHAPAADPGASEWMVTNESPEGFALMHVSGDVPALRAGEVAALHPVEEGKAGNWHVGLIRWALSENPEHIELGLQQVAAGALPARIVRSAEAGGNISALLLSPAPPARTAPALLLPAGILEDDGQPLVVITEGPNLRVREFAVIAMIEQTAETEVFSLAVVDS